METSTLRPGLLVSLKTSLDGGVSYRKKILEGAHLIENGAQRAKWETVRVIADPVEHDKAVKTRAKIRNTVTAVCAASAFGLLCPDSDVKKLELALLQARKLAKEFNDTAKVSRVNVYIMTGRIAPDDAEAIRAINSEVADLIKTMENGLKGLDVKAVREAANKARAVGTMLTGNAAEKVNEAIAQARKAARRLVKAGEAAAVEVDYEVIKSLADARTAFLDVDTPVAEVAAPETEDRTLEVELPVLDRDGAPLTPEEAESIREAEEQIIAENNAVAAMDEFPALDLTEGN